MELKTYGKNQIIFREGDYQTHMFGICQGSVAICTGYETPERKTIATMTQGQFFGEIGMIAMVPRTATAIALEETTLELVEYDQLSEYLIAHPENMQRVMQSVSGRIRALTEDLSGVNRAAKEAMKRRDTATKGWLTAQLKQWAAAFKKEWDATGAMGSLSREAMIMAKDLPPIVKYRSGEVIFRAGDEALCLYEIYGGSVAIYADYETPEQKRLALLSRDQIFGEMGLLDRMPRSATAVAAEPCSLRLVDGAHFAAYFREKPMKMLQLLQQMCMQLRSLTRDYLKVCRKLEELEKKNEEEEAAAWEAVDALAEGHRLAHLYDDPFHADWHFADRL